MEYREIGKTGLKGSIIGLGCEHLDGKPFAQVNETVSTALENGVNILDVFMPGKEIRENIAKIHRHAPQGCAHPGAYRLDGYQPAV